LRQLDERKTDRMVVVNGSYSTWKVVTSEVLQKPSLIFISIAWRRRQRALASQFVDNVKLRRAVNTLQASATIQRA